MDAALKRLVEERKDELSVLESGKVRATLTGHELPPRADAVSAYLASAKYIRAKELSSYDYDKHLPHVVPHQTNSRLLFCKLTKRVINRRPDEVERHVTGKRYKRLLQKFQAGGGVGNDDEDEEGDEDGLWVPDEFIGAERKAKRRELARMGMADMMEDGSEHEGDGDASDSAGEGSGSTRGVDDDEDDDADIYPPDGPLLPPRKRKARDDGEEEDSGEEMEEDDGGESEGEEFDDEVMNGGEGSENGDGDSNDDGPSDDAKPAKRRGPQRSVQKGNRGKLPRQPPAKVARTDKGKGRAKRS